MQTRSASPAIELAEATAWELLHGSDLGRLALAASDGADLFPVNYVVDGRTIVFRSAPGTKLGVLAIAPRVAFEVDGTDAGERWSVVVRGVARRLDADDEIEASGVLDLEPAEPAEKLNFVRITPTRVTGRRLARDA